MTGHSAEHSVETRLNRVRQSRPDVYALAMLASVAVRIVPDFLREVRLQLGRRAYEWVVSRPTAAPVTERWHPPSGDTEAALWFNPLLVRGRGPEGIALQPDIAQRLRVALRDAELFAEAADAYAQYEPQLPPELAWHARLARAVWVENDLAEASRLEAQALTVLRGDTDGGALARAVGHWLLHEAHAEFPELRQVPNALVSELAAGKLTGLAQPLLEDATPAELAALASYDLDALALPTTTVEVRRRGGTLEMADVLTDATYTLTVPVTNPIVLRVRPSARPEQERVLRYTSGGRPAFVEVGVGSIELCDVSGRVFKVDERAPSAIPARRPGEGGVLHALAFGGGPFVGRDAELAELRAWLRGDEPLRVLTGPFGRGKQRLSDALAREFRGRRFVGHVRDVGGLPGLLLKLAEFLGVAGPAALAAAVASTAEPTLIVLQGLSGVLQGMSGWDRRDDNVDQLINAVRKQSVVKLLLTSEFASSELPTFAVPPLSTTDVDAMLRDVVPTRATRERLVAASGGEPLVAQLLRAIATALGPDAAQAVAGSLDARGGVPSQVRDLVRAVMQRSPDRYMDVLGELADEGAVAAALRESYEPILSADPDLQQLVVWCNNRRDHRARRALVSAMDETARVPSRQLLALLDGLGLWAPTDDMVRDWPFWAAMGNGVANVLKRRDDATSGILQALLDRDITTWRWRQTQVLQIAVPKSGLAAAGDPLARAFEARLWDRAVTQRDAHRQGAWTLAKDVGSADEAREALARFADLDDWARTRLVISLVQLAPEEKEALGRLGSGESVYEFVVDPANEYFITLLLLWAQHPKHEQFDLATVFRLPPAVTAHETLAARLGLPENHLFARQPDLLAPTVTDDEQMGGMVRDVLTQYAGGLVGGKELQILADLVALTVDVGVDTSGRPLRRYDIFETFTTDVLEAAGPRALGIVQILARCLDEGLRWGIAQRFEPTHRRAATPGRPERSMPCLYALVRAGDYWEAARLMASDGNEWVVRDTIAGVADLWPFVPHGDNDVTGAAALAGPARDWIDANYHRGEEQRFDVQVSIDRLRAVCDAFAAKWDELSAPAGVRAP